MRFSLISLGTFVAILIAMISYERRPAVELGQLTGSIRPASGPADQQAADGEKADRLALLDIPTGAPEAKSGRASLVVTQSQPMPEAQPLPQAEPDADPAPQEEFAQTTTGPAARAGTPPTPSAAPRVDESALRYFAAKGDTERLQAEISRLRTLYPSWTPPADPLAVRDTGDPQLEGLWQLYAQAQYAELRKAIADRQLNDPSWQPPADLVDRLKLAEARLQLTTASDSKTYDDVVRIAAENPTLLTCSEVDVLWRLAEAFANTDKKGRARDAYLYILNNCDNTAERLATVQKASGLLSAEMLEDLLGKERTAPDGSQEFEAIRDDLARRMVGEGNTNATLVVPPAYLTRLERLAEKDQMASDALLLGWYYYRRDNLGAAERWLRRAYNQEDTAAAAEGLALTLTRQNAPVEAENVLYRWRDSSPGTKAAYLAAVANLLALDPPPILKEEVLARMAPVVIAGRDAAAAQQFGWYARTMQQPRTAAEWFAAALSWKPDDEPSAYGLVLSRNDLGDRVGVATIQRNWAGRSDRIATLGQPQQQLGQQNQLVGQQMQQQPAYQQQPQPQPQQQPAAMQAAPARLPQTDAPAPVRRTATVTRRTAPSAPATRGCASTVDPRTLVPEQALTRGWCLMDLNRPLEAAQAFDVASQSASQAARSDAAYGRSLAYLRVGLTDKAAVAAAAAPQSNTRAVELQASILADRAVNASKAGRWHEVLISLDQRAQIVPEQTDLMSLRGYAYLNTGRKPDALRLFEALAEMGDPSGQRAYADLTAPTY
jgi:tetratricopeptide (TPR) repeat protein